MQIARIKLRQLFVICSLSLSFFACGDPQSAAIRIPGKPGGDTNHEQALKALPEFSLENLQIRALEELMRVYRTSFYLIFPPAKPDAKIGCRTFRHFSNEPSLKIQYDCNWSQSLAGNDLLWTLSQEESFASAGPRSRAVATLLLSAARPSALSGAKPVTVFQNSYRRVVNLQRPTSVSLQNSYAFDGVSAIGSLNDRSGDFSQVSLKGAWSVPATSLEGQIDEFQLTYRQADVTDKQMATKTLKLIAKSKIVVEQGSLCERIHGTFEWGLFTGTTLEASGSFSADKNGLLDLKTQTIMPWPSSCIEFSP